MDEKDIKCQLNSMDISLSSQLDNLSKRIRSNEDWSENKFWFKIWILVASVVIILVISISAYNINSTNTIRSLVEKGVDPISARCAIENTTNSALCSITLLKK